MLRSAHTYRTRALGVQAAIACLVAAIACLVATFALAGCGITEPEQKWSDAAEFSWKFVSGDSVQFRLREAIQSSNRTDTVLTFDVKTSSLSHNGKAMLSLKQRNYNRSFNFVLVGDTVVVRGVIPVEDAALIAPLDRTKMWPATFNDDSITWQGTIAERLLYRNVDGTVHKDLVVAEYRPTSNESLEREGFWRCYFARGIGLVEAVQYFGSHPDGDPLRPLVWGPNTRWVLVRPAGK